MLDRHIRTKKIYIHVSRVTNRSLLHWHSGNKKTEVMVDQIEKHSAQSAISLAGCWVRVYTLASCDT